MSSRSLRVALTLLDRRGRMACAAAAAITAAHRVLLVACAIVLTADDRRAVIGTSVGLLALYALGSFLRSGVRVDVESRIHRRAATALLEADPLQAVEPDGDPELILGQGVHYGSSLVADRLPGLVGDAIAAVVVVGIVASTQAARLLAWGAAGLVLAVLAAVISRRLTLRAQDRAWESYRPVLDRMLIAMRGRLELIANGADVSFLHSLDALLVSYRREMLRANRIGAIASRLPLFAGAVGIAIAIAAQGGSSSLNGIGLGDLAILGSALPTFVGLAQNAHETWLLTLRFRPMASILAVAPAKKGGTEVLPDDASRVVFTDVAFRYPAASSNAVEGVSVQFELGEPLVLTGPNGSGKSTLLRLLAGLALPTTGRIDIGGRSFAELDLAALRSSVAYLPQQSHLPEGMSVEDAIRMFVPTVSVADMRSALDRVGVLASLQGRDADNPLRVRIGLLSVGQRKRVALARVLLKDARLVLLDEPDANLDAEGVEMVARLMHDLARTRLVAIAAHTEKLVASRGVHVRLAA